MNVYAILDFILEVERTPSTPLNGLTAGNSDFDLGKMFNYSLCRFLRSWYIFKLYYVISTLIQIQFCGRNFISAWQM